MHRWIIVGLFAVSGLAAAADEPKPDPKTPPYERMLKGDDAKKAAELQKKIAAAKSYEELIERHEELLVLRTRLQGADHWQTLNVKWELDAYRKVAGLPVQQREICERATRGYIEAIQLEAKGQHSQAQLLLQDHIQSCDRFLGEKHPKTAEVYNRLAMNLNAQGKHAAAQALYQKALDLYREVLGERHPDTATVYSNLGENLARQGKHADAQPLFQKSLQIRHGVLGDRHGAVAEGYNNLGMNLNDQGRYAEARVLCQKALDLAPEVFGEKHPTTAIICSNLAMNLNSLREYAEAHKFYQRALDLTRESFGDRHLSTAIVSNNLAMNFAAQGKYAEAHPLFRKALDVRRELLGDKHPATCSGYNNLAMNFAAQGKYAEAHPLFRKALDVRRELLGDKHPETALSYQNLALVLVAQQKFTDAEALLTRATGCYEAARLGVAARGRDRAGFGLERSPYAALAATHANLHDAVAAWAATEANLARGLGDESASRRGDALAPREQSEQADLVERLQRLQPRIVQLAAKAALTGKEERELDDLLGERREAEARLSELAVALSKQVATFAEVRAAVQADAALVLWVDVADRAGRVQEHWGCVVRRMGEPRWERLPGTGPEKSWTSDDTALPKKLRTALASVATSAADLDALATRLHAQRLVPLAKHLDGVRTLYVVPVHEMAGVPIEVLTREYTVSYVPSGTFLARLKDKPAPTGTALLALGDPIFTRPDDKSAGPRPLPPGGLLIAQVAPDGAAAKARLRPGDVLVRYADTELTSLEKLDQAIAARAAVKSVTVTVWRDAAEKPVTFTEEVAPGRLGVALAKEPARDAIADRRKTDATLTALRGGGWKDLPGTRAEVAQLASLFGPSATVLVDGAASEQKLDELRAADGLKGFRYLHLATHGEANNVRAFESALILSQDALPKDQLPRAGQPFVNGQLSANEVLEFWKLNAELVTLSACESGLGRAGGGDGLLGFAQAFLTSGSRAVCLSLWKVDDAATALLMARFYQNLLGKRPGLDKPLPKAVALAEAKRWLRELSLEEALQLTAAATKGVVRGDRSKDQPLVLVPPGTGTDSTPAKAMKPFAHPRYWAAFVLIGDPN